MPWTWDNVKKRAVRVRDEVAGINELARALSQSIVAEPLAGLAGIYGTVTGGVGEGVRLIDKVREKVGYQPETKEGIRNLDALARALSPVNNALEKARTTLGDGAFNATGSPALAAAAYTAPDAILSALGARPAMAAGRSAQAGIGRAVRRASELPSPTMGSPASQIGAIRAYHGTPHDFDRFSMDKIGTGEGAQAYGHGLYFAGDRKVAESYRDGVPQSRAEAFNGSLDALPKHLQGDAYKLMSIPHGFRRDAHLEALRERAGEHFPTIEAMAAKRPNLYEVELAPDETDLLDWDAPLSEQPEKVRAALQGVDLDALGMQVHRGDPDAAPMFRDETYFAPKYGGKGVRAYSSALKHLVDNGKFPPDMDGNSLITTLNMALGDGEKTSAFLRQRGIPGLRYLDGGSRAAGDGSRNYVMFDDSLIKILGKK